ncbi:para-aminobenzoate synthetase component 1 [Malonomonas rubra DSM 5091]|uniref:Anthranilate synthase component 1 n=1 Tax=Malonomonas rubra DSM 5091 TaxID=1122189 RepID=A0A1M6C6A5_MALRU|nr:anthranilate synthase component I family protein [Malonomonas rubra]SHI56492.1 para-aminobenzoate synthetase component 1 [Malonomonas rubra DSM 5091]
MTVKSISFPLADFDPLTAYQQLCPQGPGLLESLNPLPKTGRYSILPLRSRERYQLLAGKLYHCEKDQRTKLTGDPLTRLADILQQRWVQPSETTPFPGGFFGYFGYDLAQQIENLPSRAERDLLVADIDIYWVDTTAVYNHQHKQLTLASLDAAVDLEQIAEQIRNIQVAANNGRLKILEQPQAIISQARFEQMVQQGKDYIAAGDIYQVNLSCRFDGRIEGDSTELYRQLRRVNPSPFACLLHFPELDIISSSPERLVSLLGNLAETRPIAGTRPRGYTPPEDQLLGEELLGHPKERAEHIMLLDLERNDLGKVCTSGSVKVDELMVLERYSHVTHIVSNVRGELRSDCGPIDLLRATFPGGTITGVPKKRCMEIIDELEPVGRGCYTGSAGYISACGNMDLNILIRTFQRIGKQLSYQTGAGIVADSIPEKEWLECMAKGEALRKVLQEAMD